MKKTKHTIKKYLTIFFIILSLSTELYGVNHPSNQDDLKKLTAGYLRRLTEDEFIAFAPGIINRARKNLNQNQTELTEIEKSLKEVQLDLLDLETDLESATICPCCNCLLQ
jgi:hypothetical protein